MKRMTRILAYAVIFITLPHTMLAQEPKYKADVPAALLSPKEIETRIGMLRRLHEARSLFHFYATGITPAMVSTARGAGTQYVYAERDADGNYLDGSKTYQITLPGPVPVQRFWSFMVYDSQTRSMLETDQRSGGIDSNSPDLEANADGSYTVWFGPEVPEGKEGNWVETMPGKGWHTVLRSYGPLEPFFDKS